MNTEWLNSLRQELLVIGPEAVFPNPGYVLNVHQGELLTNSVPKNVKFITAHSERCEFISNTTVQCPVL